MSDTPKIAALLLAASAAGMPLEAPAKVGLVAFAMVLGGLICARRVAETMSHKIAHINCGQGLTANLVTAALVLGASRLGLPVSTTQVACSAIFGIGLVNGERHWHTVAAIGLAWLFTLPVGLILGALFYWAIT